MRRFLALLLSSLPLAAQQASVSGHIADASQKIIAGAAVKLTDTKARVAEATTNSDGYFSFPSVEPGAYELEAEYAGFATARLSGLRVEVGETRHVTVELRPSAVTETVNVEASSTPLIVNRADRSQVVENTFINSIPLNVRNPLQFLNYTVGVTPANRSSGLNTSSQSQTNTFRINGAKGSTTDILLDGAVNTTSYANQAAGVPQVDAVQESRVFTSAYAPEYGRTSGGMVLFALKSGTNDSHGTLHEFLRNSQLDANGFNANKARVPRQSFQRNQFGLTVGGPITIPKLYNGRNKTFFFIALEGLRERAAGSFTGTVPTDLERRGDFSQSRDVTGALIAIYDPRTTRLDPSRPAGTTRYIRDLYPSNAIPVAAQSALAQNILRYIPGPNQPGLGLSNTNNFFSSDPTRNQQDRADTRLDHNINENHRLFVRWNYFQNLNTYNDPYRNAVSPTVGNNRLPGMNMMAQYTWIVNPAMLVQQHFAFGQHESNRTSNTIGFDASALGINKNTYDGAPVATFPQVLGNRFTGVGQSTGYERNRSRVYQYEATVSYLRGRHSFKAGFDFRLYGVKLFTSSVLTLRTSNNFTGGPNPQAAAAASGHGIADLLLNAGTASNTRLLPDLSHRLYYGAFWQDEFRWTPKLTLTYGLRYNLELPDMEDNDHYTFVDLASASPIRDKVATVFPNLSGGVGYVGINGLGDRTQIAQKRNFDPRIGIAYQMNDRTVIRSGFGIFHHPAPSFIANGSSMGFSQITTSVATQADGVTPLFNLADPFPSGMLPLTGNTLGLSSNLGQSITAPLRIQNVSYQANWSFDVQREVLRNLVLTVGYAGNSGVRLLSNVNLNQLPDTALGLGSQLLATVSNPFAGVITDSTSLLSRPTVQYGQLLRPYPQFQNVTASLPGVGHSSYHALQLQVERRLTNGLAILFAYTHSKTIDNTGDYQWVGDFAGFQNNNCFSCDRSLSLQHIPDVVRMSTRYELPLGPGKPRLNSGVLSRLAGGWAVATFLTWDNGTPVRLTSPNDTNSFGGGTNNRPSATGQSASLESGPAMVDGGQYFNTAAFLRTPAFQFGNASRTIPGVRVPGVYNWDLMIEKRTRLAERVNLDFRTEMFNVFNLVNFAGPGTNIATADFGKIFLNQVNSPRQIQFGLRLVY